MPNDGYVFDKCNLLDLNEDQLLNYVNDNDVSLLMITVGFGRVADFEFHHIAEIKNMMTVNATATIQVLRLFYNRIKNDNLFYYGVMGSIAGLMSSPAASVYAASKAAICRFIESVNTELETSGTNNRILNVAPASFKGSKFYGGENDLTILDGLASEILKHMLSNDTLFIPQFEETFKAVLERYKTDPHEYGLHSYSYKKGIRKTR